MHGKSLVYKFLFTAVILMTYLTLVARTNLLYNLIISAVCALVLYPLGDLMVLPATGNVIAAAADAIVISVIIWIMQYILPGFRIQFRMALYGAIIVGLFEILFHRYLKREVIKRT